MADFPKPTTDHRPPATILLKRLPLLIIVVALAIWLGSFIIKNFLGVSLIAYGLEDASRDAAVRFAPGNPEILAARGRYLLYRADPPRLAEAMADLERAVQVSPRDYRFRLELGKAYESNGDAARAEAALLTAVELAPKYFETRWALANLRLRLGRTEAALDDLRAAIELSAGYSSRPDYNATTNAFNVAAGAVGVSVEALRRVAPGDNVSQAYLAGFLAGRDALDQALRMWRGMSADDPDSYRSLIFQLLYELQVKSRFTEEKEVWDRLMSLEGRKASGSDNPISNPGFEEAPLAETYSLLIEPPTGFDWVFRRHTEVRVQRQNEEKHTGMYALQLTFAASMRSEFQETSQLIAVEPAQAYRLSYFVKTRNISNETPPLVEISDARPQGVVIARLAAPSGTNDWIEQSVTLTTPAGAQGLRLIVRSPQLKTIDRSRIVEVWFDDFKLEKQ